MPVKLNKRIDKTAIPIPIPSEEIDNLKKAYVAGMQKGDATSAWVSTEEIYALINDNTANEIKINGIRIYYGRHYKSTELAVGVEYNGLHTVILVATASGSSSPIPENSKDQLNINKNSVTYTTSYKGMGDDYVPLCPPRCYRGRK